MNIKNARVFTPGFEFEEITVGVDGQIFCHPDRADPSGSVDAKGLMAVPGFIDTHMHGAMGCDFMDGTRHALATITKYEAKNGITSLCPATMTMSDEDIFRACSNGADFRPEEDESDIVGMYMEGPFVSRNKLGAQNPKYVKPPSADFFRKVQGYARGMVKVLAMAPETEGGISTIEELKGEVLPSVAHTECDYDLAVKAFRSGANRLTHVYNAMPVIHHRKPGPVLAAVDAPGCDAEIICDGFHIHPAAVRMAFRLFGPERMIMISDSMMAAGLEDGHYTLGGLAVEVRESHALLMGGSIAGSTTNLYECFRRAVRDMGIKIEDAVRAASYNPARSIGLEKKIGSIAPGHQADLLLIDDELNLKAVLLRGRWLFNHA